MHLWDSVTDQLMVIDLHLKALAIGDLKNILYVLTCLCMGKNVSLKEICYVLVVHVQILLHSY